MPQIVELRLESNEPICVYLDSSGGEVFFANMLMNLIRCPNQDGQRCNLITVGVGFVASCAADFLALGDYSIIYPTCNVHYHGTRQRDDEITLQKIPYLAGNLRTTNEQYAFRLAARMFRRMVFHIMEMMIAQGVKPTPENQELFAVTLVNQGVIGFQNFLAEKLKSLKELVDHATAKQKKFNELVKSLRASDTAGTGIDIKDQSALFKHLLDLELRANPKTELTDILPIIEDDYEQIRDFFLGRYQRNLKGIVHQSGVTFLSPEEKKQWQAEPDKQTKIQFLLKTVSPRLEPLWFLVVSLCRALQEGEFPMNPEEAYWTGLVDEVIGANLPCLRNRNTEIEAMAVKEKSQSPPNNKAATN